jgi:hypothetical protein
MSWFRSLDRTGQAVPVTGCDVSAILAEIWQPGHFFVNQTARLEWQYLATEEVPWEIYNGRLLEAGHCLHSRRFESWNIFWLDTRGRSTEPFLSLKLDREAQRVYVTRAIYCHAWQGYHAGDNVYLSRETCKWVRELVGTVLLDRFRDLQELRDELICLLFLAVVGVSRLPLTSLEAPLPAFTLGQVAYFHRPGLDDGGHTQPLTSCQDLIEHGCHETLARTEKARLLELVLRAAPASEVGLLAHRFAARWARLGHSSKEFFALLRRVFNEVALSPYTDLVDRTLQALQALVQSNQVTMTAYADFLGYLLRLSARHLAAYDLELYHHRGANYPDALLLDAVLKTYLALIEAQPELFLPLSSEDAATARAKSLRRRALRQGWVARRSLEGLPVPEEPTSPGENQRILPPPHVRVPEEHILVPSQRTKRLYADSPLGFSGLQGPLVMRQALADLQQADELSELGTAVFLDRPLGDLKLPTEPDQTILLSYEAFSPSVAGRRLYRLRDDAAFAFAQMDYAPLEQTLESGLAGQGIPLRLARLAPRPGAVSLNDAVKVAGDFQLLRTTSQTARAFLDLFDFTPLAARVGPAYLERGQAVLIVRAASVGEGADGVVAIYDARGCRRLELRVVAEQGYRSRGGLEFPAGGLQVLRVCEPEGREHNLQAEDLRLLPRV